MTLQLETPAPSPKRAKGTGTIVQRSDGKYRALYAFTAGKREEIDGSPFPTYADAERALATLLLELQRVGATNHGQPLRKIAEKSFDSREAGGYRAVKSDRDRWSCYLEQHELANVPIGLVSKGEVRDLLNGMRNQKTGKPLATQTKRNVLNMLRALFEYAVEQELLEDNPLEGMKVKESGRVTEVMRPLTWAQAKRLLAIASDPAIPLAIGTGMRDGEVRALRWEHVHLSGPKPHILCCYGGTPNKPRKNGKVLRIPLFGMALEALRALWKKTPKARRTGVVLRSKTGCYRTKGRAVEPKDWKAWLEKAGIDRRVRFHDLRHTCATLLLNGDLGRKWTYEEVKELLDHSSVKVTERYAKALGTLADKAADEMRASKKGGAKAPKAASDEIQMGSKLEEAIVAKALEIIGRRGSDSNRRMTVLQSHRIANDVVDLSALWIRAGSYVKSIAGRDGFEHVRGLDLADAVFDLLEAVGAAEEPARAAGARR